MSDNLLPSADEIRRAELDKKEERINNGFCPECASYLMETEGCKRCLDCGWSACE